MKQTYHLSDVISFSIEYSLVSSLEFSVLISTDLLCKETTHTILDDEDDI
jgi:hypothetical protein